MIKNKIRRKKGIYGTVNSKNLEEEQKRIKDSKKSAAMITSVEWKPITQKTYQFETRRKKSTKGYRISGGKHFKAYTIVK